MKNNKTMLDRDGILTLLEVNDKRALSTIDAKLKEKWLRLEDKTILKLIKSVLLETMANTRFIYENYFYLMIVGDHVKIISETIEDMISHYAENFDSQQFTKELQNLKKQNESNQEVIDLFKMAFKRRYFGSEK